MCVLSLDVNVGDGFRVEIKEGGYKISTTNTTIFFETVLVLRRQEVDLAVEQAQPTRFSSTLQQRPSNQLEVRTIVWL